VALLVLEEGGDGDEREAGSLARLRWTRRGVTPVKPVPVRDVRIQLLNLKPIASTVALR